MATRRLIDAADRHFVWLIIALVIAVIVTVILVVAALNNRRDNVRACEAAGGIYVRVSPGDHKCLDVKEIDID